MILKGNEQLQICRLCSFLFRKHEKLSIHEDCSYMVIASVITSGSHFTRMNFDNALHQSQNTDDC